MGLLDRLEDLGRPEDAQGMLLAQSRATHEILVEYLEAAKLRETRIIDLQRDFWSNNILQSGLWRLDASLCAKPRFNVPYAWLYVADPFSIGPLWIVNSRDDSVALETASGPAFGVGRWVLPAGCMGAPVPLYGDQLTIYCPNGAQNDAICAAAMAS